MTGKDKRKLKRILAKYVGKGASVILPVLQEIQQAYNYLPREALVRTSQFLNIPASRIFGIVTFYSQFSLEKRGKHLIRLCDGTACHVKGSRAIREALKEKYGLVEGKTTPDGKFTLQEVACLGSCFLSPVLMVDAQYYGNLTAEKALNVFKNLK